MENRDDAFLQLICAFAKASNVEVTLNISYSKRQVVLNEIKLKDEKLFDLIYNLGNIKDAYQFIRFDKELILKAHDIWKSESKKMGDELNKQLNIVSSKAKSLNVDVDDFVKTLRVE